MLVFAVGCRTNETERTDIEGSPEAIAAASRLFSQSYVNGDTTALGDLYTMDAVLLPPSRDVKGRAEIKRYFAPNSRRKNITHAMESSELIVEESSAVDIGTWSNNWQVDEGEVQSASGRYMVVWVLESDRQWRIRYDMWHSPVSP
jgi:ketosteroid isomerase-like protein